MLSPFQNIIFVNKGARRLFLISTFQCPGVPHEVYLSFANLLEDKTVTENITPAVKRIYIFSNWLQFAVILMVWFWMGSFNACLDGSASSSRFCVVWGRIRVAIAARYVFRWRHSKDSVSLIFWQSVSRSYIYPGRPRRWQFYCVLCCVRLLKSWFRFLGLLLHRLFPRYSPRSVSFVSTDAIGWPSLSAESLQKIDQNFNVLRGSWFSPGWAYLILQRELWQNVCGWKYRTTGMMDDEAVKMFARCWKLLQGTVYNLPTTIYLTLLCNKIRSPSQKRKTANFSQETDSTKTLSQATPSKMYHRVLQN